MHQADEVAHLLVGGGMRGALNTSCRVMLEVKKLGRGLEGPCPSRPRELHSSGNASTGLQKAHARFASMRLGAPSRPRELHSSGRARGQHRQHIYKCAGTRAL
eukprot:1162107-Pelagomonas_calceolata.AAC.5